MEHLLVLVTKPDNVPIVAIVLLLPFFTWLAFSQGRKNDRAGTPAEAVRVHCCNDCGLVLDRDHNAAINIKKAAVALREGMVVTNTPETPRQRKEAQNLVNPGETGNKPQPFRVG